MKKPCLSTNKRKVYSRKRTGEPHHVNAVIIVSGLPRSGTSMMMKMLEAGRIPILTDNVRRPDEDNPAGYYEFEKVKELQHDRSWLKKACGKAVKIVSPMLEHLNVTDGYRYKIIFMLRNLDEVLASQKKMSHRLNGNNDTVSYNILKHNYSAHLEKVRHWMEHSGNIDFTYVNYSDVINAPCSVAKDIADFLGIDLNTEKMGLVVDGSLYRNRRSRDIAPASPQKQEPERELILDQLMQLGYL